MTPSIQANSITAAPVSRRLSATRPKTRKPVHQRQHAQSNSKTSESSAATVFDRLYDEYLPFRLYADYMLGKSPAALAHQFGLAEHWVVERIEALRLCLGKQVRVNLLAEA